MQQPYIREQNVGAKFVPIIYIDLRPSTGRRADRVPKIGFERAKQDRCVVDLSSLGDQIGGFFLYPCNTISDSARCGLNPVAENSDRYNRPTICDTKISQQRSDEPGQGLGRMGTIRAETVGGAGET